MEIHLRNMHRAGTTGHKATISAHRSAANMRALVVDDHIANLRLSALLLEELGFQVHTATNGLDAVGIAEQEDLHLIIMDVHMPVLDGIQATGLIRKTQAESLPIVGLSANVTSADRTRLQSAGMNDVLAKPLTRAQLEGIMEAWLPTAPGSTRAEAYTDTYPARTQVFCRERALRLANNNGQLANELFQLMIASLPADQLKINEAWQYKNDNLFLKSIHRLNGAARYCGFPGLAISIDRLETAIKSGANQDISAAMGLFNEEVRRLLTWHLDNPDPLDIGTDVTARSNHIPE